MEYGHHKILIPKQWSANQQTLAQNQQQLPQPKVFVQMAPTVLPTPHNAMIVQKVSTVWAESKQSAQQESIAHRKPQPRLHALPGLTACL